MELGLMVSHGYCDGYSLNLANKLTENNIL